MSKKGIEKLCILYKNFNSETYIYILEHFLISSTEDMFRDSAYFIFQDDNTSCQHILIPSIEDIFGDSTNLITSMLYCIEVVTQARGNLTKNINSISILTF